MLEHIQNPPTTFYFDTTQEQKDALVMAIIGHPQYGDMQAEIVDSIIVAAREKGNNIAIESYLAILQCYQITRKQPTSH